MHAQRPNLPPLRFDQLAAHLKDETLEGMDENNVHRFHHALCLHLPAEQRPELPDALLLEYDQAIVSVTQRLNERRLTRGDAPIVWKYFQYLALLFTEIYLDRYFRDPRALLVAINQRIATLNEGLDESDEIAPLDAGARPELAPPSGRDCSWRTSTSHGATSGHRSWNAVDDAGAGGRDSPPLTPQRSVR